MNFYQIDWGYIIMWQFEIVNIKDNVLPVCDKPSHTNEGKQQKGEKKVLQLLVQSGLLPGLLYGRFVTVY